MNSKKTRFIALAALVVIIGGVLWWVFGSGTSEKSPNIATSGFIEAKELVISMETGGRITAINATEGEDISANKLLVKLDDALLSTEKRQAEANVQLAQAYLAQAIASEEGARKALENATDVQLHPLELEARIIAAEGELELAKLDLLREQDIESNLRIPSASIRLDTAEQVLQNYRQLESSVGNFGTGYDRKISTLKAEMEFAEAELNLAYQQQLQENWSLPRANTRYEIAEKSLANLLTIKENPQEINALVDQAYTTHQVAKAAVKVAGIQVELAESSAAYIDTRLAKLAIASPVSGVVSAIHYEVGETVQPGAPVLTVINLQEVTLTAYVPESKIGLIMLGQEAAVSVDSYPEETFSGKIVYISPQALFTPKNIQLKEEREKMVFSVKIRLANPEQKLKAGMPADALIMVAPGN